MEENPPSGPWVLTPQQYQQVKVYRCNHTRMSWKRMFPGLLSAVPSISQIQPELVQDQFNSMKDRDWSYKSLNPYEWWINESSLVEMLTNPEQFLLDHPYPAFAPRGKEPWIPEEEELLVQILHALQAKGKNPNWGFMALGFPGRSGNAVYQKYLQLLERGIIEPLVKQVPNIPFSQISHMIFLPHHEEMLSQMFISMFEDGQKVTADVIREEANSYFNSPIVIGERATYAFFLRKGLPIYDSNQKFTEQFKKEAKVMIDQAKEDPAKIIEEYSLPDFRTSDQWIHDFMKRNSLSWRRAHYQRRGDISKKDVKNYLNQLASAIQKYSYDRVFNMDETCVRIQNGSDRCCAPTGIDAIVINDKKNTKENFTAIFTCTANNIFPPCFIGKGKTSRCGKKFGMDKKARVFHSQSGWTTVHVMKKYLHFLHHKIANKEPCALVLDLYSTHRAPEVLKYARSHNIELIFVPGNGTGLYQPLDRRLFGIVKAKLRSYARSKIYNSKDRFALIAEELFLAWNSVSGSALASAWDIPGLKDELTRISEGDNLLAEKKDEEEEDLSDDDFIPSEEEELFEEVMEEEDLPEMEDEFTQALQETFTQLE